MALTAFSARADILNVPSEFATIQMAIDASLPGDEIVIAPGIYKEELHTNNDNITLTGAGIDATIISGDLDGTGSNSTRGPEFNIFFGSVLIQDLTLSGFDDALLVYGFGNVEIRNCKFIHNKTGPVLLTSEGNNLIQGCTFEQNQYLALRIEGGSANTHAIRDCTFRDGYSCIDGDNITIENSTFTNHTQIAVTGNDYIVRDCVFTSNNNAIGTGGDLVVENCHFENNTGDSFQSDGGAAIYHRSGNCTISNSTFVRNTTEGRWGGAVDLTCP